MMKQPLFLLLIQRFLERLSGADVVFWSTVDIVRLRVILLLPAPLTPDSGWLTLLLQPSHLLFPPVLSSFSPEVCFFVVSVQSLAFLYIFAPYPIKTTIIFSLCVCVCVSQLPYLVTLLLHFSYFSLRSDV